MNRIYARTASGTLLDYLAGKAFGLNVGMTTIRGEPSPCYWEDNEWDGPQDFSLPAISSSGEWLAKILSKGQYHIYPIGENKPWICSNAAGTTWGLGATPEIAAARCLVIDKLGLNTEIPDWLNTSAPNEDWSSTAEASLIEILLELQKIKGSISGWVYQGTANSCILKKSESHCFKNKVLLEGARTMQDHVLLKELAYLEIPANVPTGKPKEKAA